MSRQVSRQESAVRRQVVSDGHTDCTRCGRNIRAGDEVEFSAPNRDRSAGWRDASCHPSCEAVRARVNAGQPPSHPPPNPALRIFPNEFEGVVCCGCNCYIEVGEQMSAIIGPGLPKWREKKHHPACPPGGTPADLGGMGILGMFGYHDYYDYDDGLELDFDGENEDEEEEKKEEEEEQQNVSEASDSDASGRTRSRRRRRSDSDDESPLTNERAATRRRVRPRDEARA